VVEHYGGWKIVSEHLSNQQRLQVKSEHAAANGDHTTVEHQMENGWSIKKLGKKSDFELEGKLMDHCVGGYGPERGYHDVYSLRDPDDLPMTTFQMRRRSEDDSSRFWNHGATSADTDHSLDTGNALLATTNVLGRNDEQPKEDYARHLVRGLSEIAKKEGIAKVSWGSGGPHKTPEQLDDFLKKDTEGTPQDVYLKVPQGMKAEDGGVDFTGGEERSGKHNNIKVSTEEPEAQFGYHVFKTPFSEKRFEKEDDFSTRLNNPDKASGGYRIKSKPGSRYNDTPNTTGLNKNQSTLIHEAKTPDTVYLKMLPADWDKASHACGTCGATGQVTTDTGSRRTCGSCEGSGRGDSFSLKGIHNFRYGGVQTTVEPTVKKDAEEPDYDNMEIKLPFSEKNFDFNPETGGYTAKKEDAWSEEDAAKIKVHSDRILPAKLYLGVPSKERQNKYVYSEEGVQPVFLRNKRVTASPDRQHFVGSAGNDIIEVDTSKLPKGALLNHSQRSTQSEKSDPWGSRKTHMWEMNPRVAIPYEAITKPGASHTIEDKATLKQHLIDEHDTVAPSNRQADIAAHHDALHADWENNPQGEHGPLPTAINVSDQSEQNKRKPFVAPVPGMGGIGPLTVHHEADPPVESVQFQTRLNGKTVEGIKSLEAGNIPQSIGVGIPATEGDISYGNDVKVKVKNSPEHVEEVTPTIKQIREGAGQVQAGGEDGVHLGFGHETFPSNRFFKLKQDLPAGHPAVQSFEHSGDEEARQPGHSIIPDTVYVHVPRRRRGNTDLYGENGIDLNHVTEDGNRNNRYPQDLKTGWSHPLEGERNALRTGEDPSEFDVWAVDPHKMPKAHVELGGNPYQYSAAGHDTKHVGVTLPEGATTKTCGACGGDGKVYLNGDTTQDSHACSNCNGTGKQGTKASFIPWDAVKNLHRKPEEPTAPAIRKFFNTASVAGYKHIFVVR